MRLESSTLVLLLVRGLVLVDLGRTRQELQQMVPSWLDIKESGGEGKERIFKK